MGRIKDNAASDIMNDALQATFNSFASKQVLLAKRERWVGKFCNPQRRRAADKPLSTVAWSTMINSFLLSLLCFNIAWDPLEHILRRNPSGRNAIWPEVLASNSLERFNHPGYPDTAFYVCAAHGLVLTFLFEILLNTHSRI